MRLKILLFFVAITLTACNAVDSNSNGQVNNATRTAPTVPTPAAPAQVPQQGGEVKRVTTAELDQLLKEGKAIIVDVRNQDMYDSAHISGARLIPLQDVAARANELPRDKMIVTYCS